MLLFWIFLTAGLLCLVYGGFVAVCCSASISSGFFLWLLPAAAFFAAAFLCERRRRRGEKVMGRKNRIFLLTSLVLFLSLFLMIEGAILWQGFFEQSGGSAYYVIVLGAKVNGTEPSEILKERLDTAVSYWREHPRVTILVAGGQGEGEKYSEADVMAYYLIGQGVPDTQIVKESESENTAENLENSLACLYSDRAPTVIVTSNFHMLRALLLAKKAGYKRVTGLSAQTQWYLLPHYMFREFFSLIKDFLFGNI